MIPLNLQFPQILAMLNPDDIKESGTTGIETTKECDNFLYYLFRNDGKQFVKFVEFMLKNRKEILRQKALKRKEIIVS